jgi:hypothetical protein
MARRGNGAGWGGPARGFGKGDGWGGPAKGPTQVAAPGPRFTRDMQPTDRSTYATTREMRLKRSAWLEDKLMHLAEVAEREETQLAAATKLHAIYNGQPVARNITLNTDDVSDLSDEQIRSELERFGDPAASAETGTTSPSVSPGLPDILH